MMLLTVMFDKARAEGFETVAPLSVDTLSFLPEIRNMCQDDRCHKYHRCWTCPPACGTLEQCEKTARAYDHGILMQTVGELEDAFDYEGFMRIEALHKQRLLHLVEELHKEGQDILPMSAGACTICENCTYPTEPCRHPEKALISMEAFGLWVSDVCKKNNVPYNYGEKKLAYTSCILLKEE